MKNTEKVFIHANVVGEFKHIEALYKTITKELNSEGEEEITSSIDFRGSYDCLTNISKLPKEVADVAKIEWTEQVIENYRNSDPYAIK
tara:strand:- start:37 stop:300 length:264 start_codon:yes stop_codon:yes gene_type:complete